MGSEPAIPSARVRTVRDGVVSARFPMSHFAPLATTDLDRLLPYDPDYGIPLARYAEGDSFLMEVPWPRLPPPVRRWVNLASGGPDRDAVRLILWVVSTPNALMRPVGCPIAPHHCGCNEKSEPHGCPYAEDIGGDFDTLCTCCRDCSYQCAMDV